MPSRNAGVYNYIPRLISHRYSRAIVIGLVLILSTYGFIWSFVDKTRVGQYNFLDFKNDVGGSGPVPSSYNVPLSRFSLLGIASIIIGLLLCYGIALIFKNKQKSKIILYIIAVLAPFLIGIQYSISYKGYYETVAFSSYGPATTAALAYCSGVSLGWTLYALLIHLFKSLRRIPQRR